MNAEITQQANRKVLYQNVETHLSGVNNQGQVLASTYE